MDTIPAGRDSSSSPNSKSELSYPTTNLKPNQVGETVLYGIPIVSLVIDGQERLCLAQISNTLLKNYSYNEIHNRRVALGITCVQCTPVQLEILRRAGAMPISSRRCGMITKREAERLCKSFLGAHSPPKLPENFAFDVSHECAWGSRGSFIPARYNSSRAKCIKCSYCNMYFSPNKFIFHSHRTPESKYTQPDAANFNSWRRHLKLTDKNCPTEILHAWEDVKAMFNGGSRKRTLPGSGSESSSPLKSQGPNRTRDSPEIPAKILSCEDTRGAMASTRSYPVIPVPSKGFGMLQKIPPPIFPHPYGFPAFGLCHKKEDVMMGEQSKAGLPGVLWPGKDSAYHSFPVFWPAAGPLPVSPYPQVPHKPPAELLCPPRQTDMDISESSDRSTNTSKDSMVDNERCSSTQSTRNEEDKSGDEGRPEGMTLPPRKISYVSAFRPVIKDADCIAKLYGNRGAYGGGRTGYLSPDFLSESSSYRSVSPCVESEGEPDVDVETNKTPEEEEEEEREVSLSSVCPRTPPGLAHSVSPNDVESKGLREGGQAEPPKMTLHLAQSSEREVQNKHLEPHIAAPFTTVYTPERSELQQRNSPFQFRPTSYLTPILQTNDESGSKEEPSSTVEEIETKCFNGQSSEENREPNQDKDAVVRTESTQRDIQSLAKEELQKQLLEQVELRKKLEREFQSLKDNFQDQMKRELSYREEMVQQLHIVREAHDALHHFSCKMLTPRHCTGSCSFKSPLLPP
ncbi:SKI family transcriptional corepressor 1 homolog-B [Xenentodon cancila]